MADTKSSTAKSSSAKSASSNTKQQTAETPSAPIPGSPLPALYPARRSDADALVGHFATINKGDEQGRYGYVVRVNEAKKDGTPVDVIFHTRDSRDEDILVKFEDLQPADPGRR